ncbi:hypothetical protein GLOIN_2v1779851 [Rhizophagus irregularis DAOM 181602=DAOM 197198]|nr:hypothetical protein GLOIN_2v1779851 [Rhizophagus irregularis DAOM 181602=DAOM 197198]
MNTLEFGRSGGLLKYRKSETPKIRLAVRVTSEIQKLQRFVSLAVRVTSEEWKKPSFISSELGSASRVGFPSSEKRKKPRFVSSGGLLKNENPKIKICSGGLPKNENLKVKISSGGLPKNENPKVQVDFRRTEKGELLRFVQVDFCLSKEWKKLKIQSVSSEEWKKPRFFSGLPKNNGKPRFVSRSLEKVEPRFVNTSLVSRVDSDKQKKPKIRNFGRFPKDQDS